MVRSSTSVNTKTENTVNFINNQLQSGFIKIANAADADITLLTEDRKRTSESLGIWIQEQSLAHIDLELVTVDGQVIESYRFDVSYNGDMGYVQFDASEVIHQVGDYSHRDNVYARVVPCTYTGSTDLGWDKINTDPAETASLTSFGAGEISVETQKILNPNRERNDTGGFIKSISVITATGAASGVLFVLLVSIFTYPATIAADVSGSNIIFDFFSAAVIGAASFFFLSIYVSLFHGIGQYVLFPITAFLSIVWLLHPFAAVDLFGFTNTVFFGAVLASGLVVLAEL